MRSRWTSPRTRASSSGCAADQEGREPEPNAARAGTATVETSDGPATGACIVVERVEPGALEIFDNAVADVDWTVAVETSDGAASVAAEDEAVRRATCEMEATGGGVATMGRAPASAGTPIISEAATNMERRWLRVLRASVTSAGERPPKRGAAEDAGGVEAAGEKVSRGDGAAEDCVVAQGDATGAGRVLAPKGERTEVASIMRFLTHRRPRLPGGLGPLDDGSFCYPQDRGGASTIPQHLATRS